MQINENWKNGDKYICPVCQKEFKRKGISTHIWRKHGEGKNHNSWKFYDRENPKTSWNKTSWNKGLTKETSEIVKQMSKRISERMKGENNSFYGKKHSEETKLEIGKKLSINNKGGRCKWFKSKRKDGTTFNVQGTWELRFSKILNKIDENWIKIGIGDSQHRIQWIDNENKKHFYTPDFYSPKFDKYFEVKGFWWGNDKEKMNKIFEQNPEIKIEMIFKKELEKYENVDVTQR